MKAVLTDSGDFLTHYRLDDPEAWTKEITMHGSVSLERFKYSDVPNPVCSPGDVLIEVHACGLNHLEVWVAQAPLAHRREHPRTFGSDIAGLVAAVGDGVTGVKLGDRVIVYPALPCHKCRFCLNGRENLCETFGYFGSKRDGGLADYVVAPEWNTVPLPQSISFVEAAAIPSVFLTAWHALVSRARVQASETVLVNAAGSGIGSAGIQIAKLFDAKVLASAGSDRKLEKAKELGADSCINYSTHRLNDEVLRLTEGQGVDVILDCLSGSIMEQSVEALAAGGRLINCGCTLGNWAKINMARMSLKERTIMGSVVGTKQEFLKILSEFEKGHLKAVVDAVFPLHQTAQAVLHLANREQFGKVIVIPERCL